MFPYKKYSYELRLHVYGRILSIRLRFLEVIMIIGSRFQVGTETQLLDYELQKEWVIQVGVFTAFTPYNGYKLITVRVLNVDEAPSFYRMPTTITINEDLPIGLQDLRTFKKETVYTKNVRRNFS